MMMQYSSHKMLYGMLYGASYFQQYNGHQKGRRRMEHRSNLNALMICIVLYIAALAVIASVCTIIEQYIGFMSAVMLWPYGLGFVPALMCAFGPVLFSLGIAEGMAEDQNHLITAVIFLSLIQLGYAIFKLDSALIVSLALCILYCFTMRRDTRQSSN